MVDLQTKRQFFQFFKPHQLVSIQNDPLHWSLAIGGRSANKEAIFFQFFNPLQLVSIENDPLHWSLAIGGRSANKEAKISIL